MSRTQTVIYHTLYPDIQPCRELKQWYTTHYIRIYNYVENSNSDIPHTISGYTTMSRTQTVIYHTLYPDIQPCRELKQWYTTHYIRICRELKQWYTTHYIRIYNHVENSNSDIPHTISGYTTMSRTQTVIYHTLYPDIQPCRELKQWYTTHYIRIYNHVENSNSDIPHTISGYTTMSRTVIYHTLYPDIQPCRELK